MMLKVTDICTTNPSDPTYCASPGSIKLDRGKASVMELLGGDSTNPEVSGPMFTGGEVWWFFTKCWADVSSLSLVLKLCSMN